MFRIFQRSEPKDIFEKKSVEKKKIERYFAVAKKNPAKQII